MTNSNGNGFKEYSKWQSRKWRLALLAIFLATLGAFLPPAISLWVFESYKPLIILSGTEWVSVVTLVVGLYIGGNVYQKHIEKKSLSAGFSLNASLGASAEAGNDDEGKEA